MERRWLPLTIRAILVGLAPLSVLSWALGRVAHDRAGSAGDALGPLELAGGLATGLSLLGLLALGTLLRRHFMRLDQLREAAAAPELDGALARLGDGDDEVGRIARTLSGSLVLFRESEAEERARVEQLLGAVPDAVVVVRDDGTIEYANPYVQHLFGWAPEEVLGERVETLVPVATRARHVGLRTSFAERPRLRPMGAAVAVQGERKDGTTFYADIQLSPATIEGRQVVVASVRDVTERQETRRRLEELGATLERANRELAAKNQRLERLNAEKNQLLGMAAHDLRNPLGVVYGYASVLEAEFDSLSLEEAREMSAVIAQRASFMRGLLDDLLDLASIEAGTLRLAVKPTNPVELARKNVVLNQILAASKSIRVHLEAPELLPLVDVDDARFDQVLNNLLSNAVKYSDPDSDVVVRVRPEGALVRFDVIDQGRGIAPDFLGSMFAPFAKEGATGTAGEKSTGLGLAIVKRIVDAHGGRIAVESTLGRGSTFSVWLPAYRSSGTGDET